MLFDSRQAMAQPSGWCCKSLVDSNYPRGHPTLLTLTISCHGARITASLVSSRRLLPPGDRPLWRLRRGHLSDSPSSRTCCASRSDLVVLFGVTHAVRVRQDRVISRVVNKPPPLNLARIISTCTASSSPRSRFLSCSSASLSSPVPSLSTS